MKPKIISIVSLMPQNGAKYLATNLGHNLRHSQKSDNVLMIDFDFYDPVLAYEYVKDSIYSLDNLEAYDSELTEKIFMNNITHTDINVDVLKGSTLGRPEMFSREFTSRIINYAKSNYDYIFIVMCPSSTIPATIVSLLNSDEIMMVVRNNYSNYLKAIDVMNEIRSLSRGKTIKIVENMSNYNENINIMSRLIDFDAKYLGALEFDASSIDNLDIRKKSMFNKNVNTSKFKDVLNEII